MSKLTFRYIVDMNFSNRNILVLTKCFSLYSMHIIYAKVQTKLFCTKIPAHN